MTKNLLKPDLCVIGGGSAGLSLAAGASQMGYNTVLVEKGEMGGDCLNYGCVPSKALLAAGKAGSFGGHMGSFGVGFGKLDIDFAAVQAHVKKVISDIAPNDSVERFEGLGVTVIKEVAKFVSKTGLVAGQTRIQAHRYVIATGSSAMVPPIEGLDQVDYLTNESVFELKTCPEHLLVLGGGPIGIEMAQAHRNLGAKVTVIEFMSILPRDDEEAADVVRQKLLGQGITLHEQSKAVSVRKGAEGQGIILTAEKDGKTFEIAGSQLLVATGRKPNLEGLGLDEAGVKYGRTGIEVSKKLRTSNKKIYAMGDVVGPYQFTHMASYHAGIVLKNILFKMPAKVDYRVVPWVTYTDPELAQVGATEATLRNEGKKFNVLRWAFSENDRAAAEHKTNGFIKVLACPGGNIQGVTIVGPFAGEMISLWVLAMTKKLKVGDIAQMIVPYPTYSEISKRAAGSFYTPKLFSPKIKKIVRFLRRFG